MADIKLDREEKELLESYDRGEWQSAGNLREEIEKQKGFARRTLAKDQCINVRI